MLLIAVVLLLCFCNASEAAEGVGVPSRFSFSIGGYGDYAGIKLHDGHFWQFKSPDGKRMKEKRLRSPSPAQWQEFWSCLETIELWKWAKTYKPRQMIDDGTQWAVEITWNGKSMKAEGDNAYPSEANPSLPVELNPDSTPFRELETGLEKLFGIKNVYRP